MGSCSSCPHHVMENIVTLVALSPPADNVFDSNGDPNGREECAVLRDLATLVE